MHGAEDLVVIRRNLNAATDGMTFGLAFVLSAGDIAFGCVAHRKGWYVVAVVYQLARTSTVIERGTTWKGSA